MLLSSSASNMRKGFTLVELSIVIVIIGLIISGITAGASLVHAARLSRVITEEKEIITGVDTFQMQYNCMPGDCANATSYWPSGTANGNGDKLIGDYYINQAESLRAFQQLGSGYANLLPGKYTGSGTLKIGVNQPQSSYNSKSTYYFYNDTLWNKYAAGNSLVLSGISGNGYDDYKVKVDDAYAMDNKIDDGMPYMGKIIGYLDTNNNCVATSIRNNGNHKTSTYLVGTGTLCTMHFAFTRYVFK